MVVFAKGREQGLHVVSLGLYEGRKEKPSDADPVSFDCPVDAVEDGTVFESDQAKDG